MLGRLVIGCGYGNLSNGHSAGGDRIVDPNGGVWEVATARFVVGGSPGAWVATVEIRVVGPVREDA